ncbi:MAG: hypothetical protein IMZ50_00170 [Candidatus Atribacteria bacterium]|nr:hypothetical protein [Candidatus Atribacteria bacterium]
MVCVNLILNPAGFCGKCPEFSPKTASASLVTQTGVALSGQGGSLKGSHLAAFVLRFVHRTAFSPSVAVHCSVPCNCSTCQGVQPCNLPLPEYLHVCPRQASRIAAARNQESYP